MSITAKALFVIERNLDQPLSLESIATACGVSRFHLAHAFTAATGRSVMDYVRARRLSEAARALVRGAPNILDVALAAGYSSHEAFSRAFRAQFATSPESVRASGTLDTIRLEEIRVMATTPLASRPAPTFRSTGEKRYVGLAKLRRLGESATIPLQWRTFMSGPYHAIAAKLETAPVGLEIPQSADDEFLYVCAAPVARFHRTPPGLLEITLSPTDYAVFGHDGHVSELSALYRAIYDAWFPESVRIPKRAATLEHHCATFDPRTGMGGVEVWVPLATTAEEQDDLLVAI